MDANSMKQEYPNPTPRQLSFLPLPDHDSVSDHPHKVI